MTAGEKGILVATDANQEWLLPWWWKHYSSCNSYPVAFIDFGMSEEGIAWCKERGAYIDLPSAPYRISAEADLSQQTKEKWEVCYGKQVWSVRSAWLKKPQALLHSPFAFSIWLDLDCQVKGDLDPLFNHLNFGSEIAIAREPLQVSDQTIYNAGVIAFRKRSAFLQKFIETTIEFESDLPGDQELLNRAIFLHKPPLLELSQIYNWPHSLGPNERAVIRHYCGGMGKIAILNSLRPADLQGIGIPKKWI